MWNNSLSQCSLLAAAGLQDVVLLPGSEDYAARQASYWAANVPMQPNCIVQPRTTEEVSRVIQILAKADGPVALRSGGHTQWVGSNDVNNGTTIDLGNMTAVTYDEESTLASIQPGVRWTGVYQELLKHQVCVTGGREGNVGVGGFLTGGGISYYAGMHGLGCDNVANFEVVLASGEVVNANATSHPDLWTALKGGSGNFGIVTRFDMYTFPALDLWGGIRATNKTHADLFAQMTVDFTNDNYKNPHTAFLLIHNFNQAQSPDPLVSYVVMDTKGTNSSPAFDSISKVELILDDVKTRSMAELAATYNSPPLEHQVWFTLSFKNDVRVIKRAGELHDDLVNELKRSMDPTQFTTRSIFQPWPALFTEHSVRRGGNTLGLEQVRDNMLLWAIFGSAVTAEQHMIMREKFKAFSDALEEFGKSMDLNVDWQYLNYVDGTQDPLRSYGQSNVDFIRKVAAKYDPEGVFQKKVVSGWKISKVDA
ncbi:hypothetical protein OPT61_g9977 [Boeremia exigua]|uniref:Uncharacterized protein n=1 Tax=Boeremia exigua TaxID=749465 RepID=A0ACC2HRZ2_9PLEO|nr:hypothetical protein OPT61_g9977 [Boeremia exigua]